MPPAGQFYFSDGTLVPIHTDNTRNSYYRNRGVGFIRLNRRPSSNETGQFHCEIPDASGTLVNLTINVGGYYIVHYNH